mgnify:CR=1 FL=1
MRISLAAPKWPVEPGRTRAVIAGYHVDYVTANYPVGQRPTDAQVLAIIAPTAAQREDQRRRNDKAAFREANGRLLRAIVAAMLDEINTLRAALLLPARTAEQIRAAIEAKIDSTAA